MMSAALLLFVGFVTGYGLTCQALDEDQLSRLVLHHIHKEPELLGQHQVLEPMKVARTLDTQEFQMLAPLGTVVAADPCWIRKGHGIHLVLLGRDGPVTVLLMPGEYIGRKHPVSSSHSSGLLLPTDYGSMAVIASSDQDLDKTMTSARNNLYWKGRPAVVEF